MKNNQKNTLKNDGIQFLGETSFLLNPEKTIVVVGVARGGTSVLAGSLDKLGVFTGEKSKSPVFEDSLLAEAIENNDTKLIKELIETYNVKYKTWGFKRPSIINHLDKMHKQWRNPIYLFVFKDIFSIANRNKLSMKQENILGLKKAHQDYEKILTFIENNDVNGCLFSYEKILTNKEAFIDTLIQIIAKENVSTARKNDALDFIEMDPTQYLDLSRITKGVGGVDLISQEKVEGWGKYIYSNKPATVELYINDILVAETVADIFKQDLLDKKIHPTGKCGFIFDFKKLNVKTSDKISVKLSEEVNYLNSSQSLFFTQHQLNQMAEGNYKEADFLRDIATLLLNKGDIANADKIISKALEKRPNGPGIIKIKEKVMELK